MAAGLILRVLCFNVLSGGLPVDLMWEGRDRREATAEVVLRLRPDVAVICEDSASQDLLARLKARDSSWSRLAAGPRGSGVYSRFPGDDLGQGRALIRIDGREVLVKAEHWWPPTYGPNLAQQLLRDGDADPKEVESKGRMMAQYKATYISLLDHLRAETPVILAGDFNEPSHLDWTERYEREGADRWVNNASGRPLRMAIPWNGSRLLRDPESFRAELGEGPLPSLMDAFRAIHPDEVARPGNTWTPPYPNGAPGRRPYNADTPEGEPPVLNQVLDRIDRIYAFGLTPIDAFVAGESGPDTDAAFDPWPSDHRAVVCDFRLPPPSGPGRAANCTQS